jgi:MFS family permease
MSAASVATALAGLLILAAPSVWTILAVMLHYNLTSTTIWPAIESGLSRTRARPGGMGLGARMALFNVSWGSAGFAAFFTRGALEDAGWHWVFVVPALAHALAWAILRFKGVAPAMIADGHVPTGDEADAPAVSPARAKTLLTMARLANAMAYVAIYVLIPLLSKLALLASMGSLVDAGMITSAWSFTRFVGFGLAWAWAGWHYRATWLIGAMAALAAGLFVTLTVHHPAALVAGQVVFGLATALIYSSALYYAMHVSHGDGGQAGLHEALIGLGIFVGPALGALSGAGNVGPEAMWRIALGITGLLAIGTLVMMALAWGSRETAPAAPPSPPPEDHPS